MSTFNGYLKEFPLIRIDCFTTLPGRPPPLAGFLSHVHTDHLRGLQSLRAPFIYCSPTTRELLLRLEKRAHRLNFAKGILESHKQTFKHLKLILKPLPLDVPIRLRLGPSNDIQVTLIDANHCPGAVMFLIEDEAGVAVLYTGDIRAEMHWVNNLCAQPGMIRYTHALQRLDNLYLDTTFAVTTDPYKEFPTKPKGVAELLSKLRSYPADSVFYFQAFTFGYEEVLITLSSFLNTKIHLDDYRYDLYTSLIKSTGQGLDSRLAPAFAGVKIANEHHPGIFTKDPNVRLHSCERGSPCHIHDAESELPVIDITPIISRHEGRDMRELGAGGGAGDLRVFSEIDLSDNSTLERFLELCRNVITDRSVLGKVESLLRSACVQAGKLEIDDSLLEDDLPLAQLADLIQTLPAIQTQASGAHGSTALPRAITFPYSRHSSYGELRHLVATLRPKDIYPCTAPSIEEFDESMTMESLFGDLYATSDKLVSSWDRLMRLEKAKRVEKYADAAACPEPEQSSQLRIGRNDEQESASSGHDAFTQRSGLDDDSDLMTSSPGARNRPSNVPSPGVHSPDQRGQGEKQIATAVEVARGRDMQSPHMRTTHIHSSPHQTSTSRPRDEYNERIARREEAFKAADDGTWAQSISLTSTTPSSSRPPPASKSKKRKVEGRGSLVLE